MPIRTNTRTGEKRRITRREKEVLRLIAQGYSSQKVADALCISKRTVDFHIANIYGKLDLQNRVQA
ncbi:MAG: helix-turn-helix domain-containing protein, partial [Fimbriimonas sp.]